MGLKKSRTHNSFRCSLIALLFTIDLPLSLPPSFLPSLCFPAPTHLLDKYLVFENFTLQRFNPSSCDSCLLSAIVLPHFWISLPSHLLLLSIILQNPVSGPFCSSWLWITSYSHLKPVEPTAGPESPPLLLQSCQDAKTIKEFPLLKYVE